MHQRILAGDALWNERTIRIYAPADAVYIHGKAWSDGNLAFDRVYQQLNVVHIMELPLTFHVEADALIVDRDRRTLGTVHHELSAYHLIPIQIETAELTPCNSLHPMRIPNCISCLVICVRIIIHPVMVHGNVPSEDAVVYDVHTRECFHAVFAV